MIRSKELRREQSGSDVIMFRICYMLTVLGVFPSLFFFFMCMGILDVCMSVHQCMCVWFHKRPEKGVWSPGSGVTDGCEST